MGLFIVFPYGTGRVGQFSGENVTVLNKNKIDKGAFPDTGRSDQNQRLVLEWCWIERVEILLRIYEDIILHRDET